MSKLTQSNLMMSKQKEKMKLTRKIILQIQTMILQIQTQILTHLIRILKIKLTNPNKKDKMLIRTILQILTHLISKLRIKLMKLNKQNKMLTKTILQILTHLFRILRIKQKISSQVKNKIPLLQTTTSSIQLIHCLLHYQIQIKMILFRKVWKNSLLFKPKLTM